MNFLNNIFNKNKKSYPQTIDYPNCGKLEMKETITEGDLKVIREENLEEGEVICSKCEGVGFVDKIESDDTSIYKNVCPKCHGTGKLDWIENIRGKKPQYFGSSSTSGLSISSRIMSIAWSTDNSLYGNGTSGLTNEIVKQVADHIAKK